MKKDYWERFVKTGKVDDYLTYRGMARCEAAMNRHRKDEESEPDDYRDRNDSVSASDWRIR